jgi:hypothetical protein
MKYRPSHTLTPVQLESRRKSMREYMRMHIAMRRAAGLPVGRPRKQHTQEAA